MIKAIRRYFKVKKINKKSFEKLKRAKNRDAYYIKKLIPTTMILEIATLLMFLIEKRMKQKN